MYYSCRSISYFKRGSPSVNNDVAIFPTGKSGYYRRKATLDSLRLRVERVHMSRRKHVHVWPLCREYRARLVFILYIFKHSWWGVCIHTLYLVRFQSVGVCAMPVYFESKASTTTPRWFTTEACITIINRSECLNYLKLKGGQTNNPVLLAWLPSSYEYVNHNHKICKWILTMSADSQISVN